MSRNRAEIIRGDDQTITIPNINAVFGDLTGGTAYLFVVPKAAGVSDEVVDPAAVITCTDGSFTSASTDFVFNITSEAGESSSLVPVATYGWYGRFVSADNKVTTFRMDDEYVEVTPPKGDY